jgi:hypothetical protein
MYLFWCYYILLELEIHPWDVKNWENQAAQKFILDTELHHLGLLLINPMVFKTIKLQTSVQMKVDRCKGIQAFKISTFF